ncbi:hypothetical protein [Parasphingorhabdus sp.]|uniref:hypothetical protein n=1 Tax=Parasphingorhabdus sp. TaxID=2709688 RepID=UPI003593A014
MKKLILAPVVAAFALAACAEQADDATLESEAMGDGTVTSDGMPEQPVLTDPVPGATMPDTAGDRMNPDGTVQKGIRGETMTPEERPMLDGQTDQ